MKRFSTITTRKSIRSETEKRGFPRFSVSVNNLEQITGSSTYQIQLGE
jgi:hypothetical protein